MVIRDYQAKAIELLRLSIASGKKRPILQLATGSGKTFIGCSIVDNAVNKGKSVLWLAPRRELIYQTVESMFKFGIHAGIIMAGEKRRMMADVQVASFDTLHSRIIRNNVMELPKADLLVVDECFTPDVEIMTDKGFVRFDELSDSAVVAQINQETMGLSFTTPIKIINKPYKGTMVTLKSDRLIDLTMTENHQLLLDYGHSRKKESASSVSLSSIKVMHTAPAADCLPASLSPFERLMIALQADGSIRRKAKVGSSIDFHFSKERKIVEFLSIMEDGEYEWSEVKGTAAKGNVKKKRRFLVHRLPDVTKDISSVFHNVSQSKAKGIIEEMVKWDGSILKNKSYYFSNTDKKAVDFYQFIAIQAGYKTNQIVQKDERVESYRDVYRLFIQKDISTIGTQNITKTFSEYDGRVYCVRVPDGNIIVRRNGKPLVIGNCHLSTAKSRIEILSLYPDATVIGLTATPCRGDGRGLGEFYDDLVEGVSIKWLISNGYLSDAKYYAAEAPDLSNVKKNATGDYQEKSLGVVMDRTDLIGEIVHNWRRIAEGSSTVVFCVNRSHARHIHSQFIESGVTAEYLDGETPKQERKEILQRISDGTTTVLCNVFVATYGLDIPRLRTVVMARPTKNIGLYLQMIGRALRVHSDKSHAIVIDHGGVVKENGFADEEQYWTLDSSKSAKETKQGKKKEKQEPKEINCSSCGAVFKGQKSCPVCGHTMIALSEDVPTHKADLKEIKGRSKKKVNKEMSWSEKIDFIGGLKTYAAEKKYSSGWVAHSYKDKTGVYPNDKRLRNAVPADVSETVRRYITHKAIMYRNRRTK